MKVFQFLAPIALATCFASGASAQSTTPSIEAEQLASCMMTYTGEAEEAAVKDLIVKALTDASASELETSVMGLGMTMLSLATTHCGLSMSDLTTPVFDQAAGLYGEQVGEKVMNKALAKIGN